MVTGRAWSEQQGCWHWREEVSLARLPGQWGWVETGDTIVKGGSQGRRSVAQLAGRGVRAVGTGRENNLETALLFTDGSSTRLKLFLT